MPKANVSSVNRPMLWLPAKLFVTASGYMPTPVNACLESDHYNTYSRLFPQW